MGGGGSSLADVLRKRLAFKRFRVEPTRMGGGVIPMGITEDIPVEPTRMGGEEHRYQVFQLEHRGAHAHGG